MERVGVVIRDRWLAGAKVPPPQTIWAGDEDEYRSRDMFPWRSVPVLPPSGRRQFWFRTLLSRLAENGEIFGSRICHRLSPGAEPKVASLNPVFLAGLGVASVAYALLLSGLEARLKKSVRFRSWVLRVLGRLQRKG
jgi:hypothetical protein